MRNVKILLGSIAIAAATVSCGDVVRGSKAPVLLVIDTLEGANGAATSLTFGSPVFSDVLTLKTQPAPCSATSPCPTFFSDPGQVKFHLDLKDIGSPTAPATGSTNNEVTLTGYHVTYTRADGRNTPGVDVPFGFDGGLTGTVPISGSLTMGFELVRNQAKEEAPLVQLENSPTIITVIAQITFFGHDVVGNAVTASGTITIEFGNFGDSQ